MIENYILQVFILCSTYLAFLGTLSFSINSFVIFLFIKYDKVINHSQKLLSSLIQIPGPNPNQSKIQKGNSEFGLEPSCLNTVHLSFLIWDTVFFKQKLIIYKFWIVSSKACSSSQKASLPFNCNRFCSSLAPIRVQYASGVPKVRFWIKTSMIGKGCPWI